MSDHGDDPLFASNPFSTKFIRSGALPFRFPDDDSLHQFRRRLEEANWCGQIVGPHGSGKTTLLRTLDNHWSRWNRRVETVSVRDEGKRVERSFSESSPNSVSQDSVRQIVVDGYEQLSILAQCRLRFQCRIAGKLPMLRRCGVLITTHRRTSWLPIVLSTETSPELAEQLVRDLLETTSTSFRSESLSPNRIREHFEDCRGNMRETFLSLYDEYAHALRNRQNHS